MTERKAWTAADIAWLKAEAGSTPLRQLARALGRTEMSVKLMAHRMGLSLRCSKWGLVWCRSCSSWRGALRPEGKCCVCYRREQTLRDKQECERIFSLLSPERRAEYLEASEKSLGRVRPLPPRPKKPHSCAMSAYERKRAEKHYALAVEAWELQCATRIYNRTKKRLQRLRETASRDM